MGTAVPASRLRRSWPQRFLITFNCILIAMCVMGASALGYSYYRFGNIPRVALGGFLANEPPGRPQNYLLVGSDSREFVQGGEDLAAFGDTEDAGAQKADTIILLRIDPQAQTAAMVSFPRDLIVTIAGKGQRDRINTAIAGGPSELIETIEANFNVPVHRYIQVDFKGFRELVDAVGGVELYLEHPVRDRDAQGNNFSGLDIDRTGCVTLDGDMALSYVRSRHFEEFIDGSWEGDLTADLGRIERQQGFITTAVRQAMAKGLTNPKALADLVGVAERNVTIDDQLDLSDLLKLGQRFQSLEPGTLTPLKLPTEPADWGGSTNNVLVVDESKADEIFDVFRGVVPGQDVVAPSSVHTRVLNGSGRAGEANQARNDLAAAGFNTADAADAGSQLEATTVSYAEGQRAKAELLASYLREPPRLVEDPSVRTVDVVLVTGLDYDGVLSSPRAVPAPAEPPAPAPAPEAPSSGEDVEAAAPTC
ncbi:MAG TPA: LCP family protein [Acidimicrobiales bacterium]|nr:LCP family protein [Acidimicrobiales bacterium]